MIKYILCGESGSKPKVSYSNHRNDFGEEIQTIQEKIQRDIKFFKNSNAERGILKILVDNIPYKEVKI